ncbi:MAG: hypothetical protein II960_02650 [Synergistaceae bacterium]|nr:hypothetical protein [Synergistaceae bacterium]
MGVIDEKLFEKVFGISYDAVQQTKHNRRESIVNNNEELMPVKENESQALIKKSPEPFIGRENIGISKRHLMQAVLLRLLRIFSGWVKMSIEAKNQKCLII